MIIASTIACFVLLVGNTACAREIDKALVSAAADGRVDRVKTLLGQGANIEARANDDWTALTIAAQRGHFEVVQLLLEKGANVNAKEGGGHTALFWAEENKHGEVIRLLKEAGGIRE